ncbi:Prephenate dehydrogenase [Thermodesulfovibrio sp. N1]|uniref:prephenate dehydrogenase n=1 Tax=Thermodesulfovibrio sp. N1 TaxID=1871110 RepID=UPI00083A3C5A|nr:prephenate dehydrogenase [Thermodesulfovibrio sp. N1]ODA44232.1 Prephenate dehydrogenase [Thermodesulfovibrio sp. N1]
MEDGFKTVSIIGVGLIGGSFALALKNKGLVDTIIGYGRNEQRLKRAESLGIINQFTTSLKDAALADIVVLATPLGVFEKIVSELAEFLKKGTVVIDVGSVKEWVVERIEKILPGGVHFVGTHPIAGSDKTGFEYARADLFEGAKVIITPTEKTDKLILEKVSKLWKEVGADVEFMSAKKHDRVYALMSHLPHLISFCMVNTVADIDKNLITYAGSGFKSFTRIAKSSPELWGDIFIMNSENILDYLSIFCDKIEEMKRLIKEEKLDELKKCIEKAKNLRERIS